MAQGMSMKNYFNQIDGRLVPKQLGIEETHNLMSQIHDLKKRRLEITSLSISKQTDKKYIQSTPTYNKAKKKMFLKVGVSALITLIISNIIFSLIPLISPIYLTLIVSLTVFYMENKKMKENGVLRELELIRKNELHQDEQLKDELDLLNTNIETMERLLTFSSVVPIRYQKEMYVSKMLEYKRLGFVKTDVEALKKVVDHYGLEDQ